MTSGTVSVRMLWPFMRVLHDFGPELAALAAAGVDSATLADADARIPRRLIGEIVWNAVQRTGDVALGVHAGEHTDAADFGVMDHAVRACPDVRRAMMCIARYTRLQDDNVEIHFMEEGERVVWQIRNAVPPILRVTNDFQVTVTVMNLMRRLGRQDPPLEVHIRHTEATDPAEYARVFRAPVRLGMPHNGVVVPRALLDQPVPSANPQAFSVFDLMATRLLKELDRTDTTTERVRRLVASRIGRDGIGIVDIGAQLHMSEATLRRRLDEEGTTYKAIVDELRRELAAQYVAEPRVAIGEIAFLLGFSTQSAFGRAFRRWNGVSPLEHRLRLKDARRAG
ncbi:MAG TPA: AraC family transcriptional regulator [Polyangiaceae bacterium]|nr:AraC family transcriptional regulator [Polyangiaceae bacterium]